jgi:hypothetical protein
MSENTMACHPNLCMFSLLTAMCSLLDSEGIISYLCTNQCRAQLLGRTFNILAASLVVLTVLSSSVVTGAVQKTEPRRPKCE